MSAPVRAMFLVLIAGMLTAVVTLHSKNEAAAAAQGARP